MFWGRLNNVMQKFDGMHKMCPDVRAVLPWRGSGNPWDFKCFLQKLNVSGTNLCHFQPAQVQRQCWQDSPGMGLAGHWLKVQLVPVQLVAPTPQGEDAVAPWGLAGWRVPVHSVVCAATSLEFEVPGRWPREHYLRFADGMLQCGWSQALDAGGAVLAEGSSQRAAGEPVLLRYLLLHFSSKPGVCFL